jgi:hypothetical protein
MIEYSAKRSKDKTRIPDKITGSRITLIATILKFVALGLFGAELDAEPGAAATGLGSTKILQIIGY